TRGKGDVTGGRLGAVTDDLLDLLANSIERNAHGFQGLRCYTLTLMDETKKDVFGADVIVVEHARLFLREHNHAACTIGKPLEHVLPLPISSNFNFHPL